MGIVVVIHVFAHNSETVSSIGLIFEPFLRIYNTNILRHQRALYDIREESYRVNRDPEIRKSEIRNPKSEIRKDRRT